MTRILEDEIFYYRHDKKRKLEGMFSSYVDDFILVGMQGFIDKITEKIRGKLEISKLEDNIFRFTGIYVQQDGEIKTISMEEYTRSMEKLKMREGKSDETFTDTKLKVFR